MADISISRSGNVPASTRGESRFTKLMRRLGAAIVKATVRGAAVWYGMDPDQYLRDAGRNATCITRA